jgi:hypothetical protein
LIFIAGTEDGRFRAFDVKTGRVVWEYIAFALPEKKLLLPGEVFFAARY